MNTPPLSARAIGLKTLICAALAVAITCVTTQTIVHAANPTFQGLTAPAVVVQAAATRAVTTSQGS